jgi:hypothetical protein
VTGDVYFGRNVTLRGTVIVVANEGQRIDIPDGCILENRLLAGNLTMTVGVLSFSLHTYSHWHGLLIHRSYNRLLCRVSVVQLQSVRVRVESKEFRHKSQQKFMDSLLFASHVWNCCNE